MLRLYKGNRAFCVLTSNPLYVVLLKRRRAPRPALSVGGGPLPSPHY
jgi:hypothetical protein